MSNTYYFCVHLESQQNKKIVPSKKNTQRELKEGWWVKELDLYATQKEELINKQLLSDNHVLAAVTL